MTEQAKKEFPKSGADQKSTVLTVQALWACHAWNTTPEEAAKQVVADLYEHLSCGGMSVHVEELGGKEHTIEATARR